MHEVLNKILTQLDQDKEKARYKAIADRYGLTNGVDTAVHAFNNFQGLTRGKFYKIERLTRNLYKLTCNNGKQCIALITNEEVMEVAQEIVNKCKQFQQDML